MSESRQNLKESFPGEACINDDQAFEIGEDGCICEGDMFVGANYFKLLQVFERFLRRR